MEISNVDILNQFDEENDFDLKKKCFVIAQDIKSGQLLIVHFVEQLKNLLVHPSPAKRILGILILTEVLKNLPFDFLNEQHLKTISVFYTEKLSDNHQVLPSVLKGILAIIKFKHFPGECVPSILNSLFHNVACQQQQHYDRYIIYEIFQLLLQKYEKELLAMGLDFVYGVISAIDGERDPRNLLFLFNWLKTFLSTVSLGHLTEEMFEVIACYFPVDFRAPPSDTNNISRDDLAEALCPCLCAVPEFAEYCIPLALEKLDSSLQIAKSDSLNLLVEGCHNFTVPSFVHYASEIWSQIQKQIFSDTDKKMKLKCLTTLTAVIKKISQSKEQGTLTSVVRDISITVKGNLFPDSKLFTLSSDILVHTALASQEAASFMVKEIVPLLTNTYSITSTPDKKAMILKSLIEFVKAYLSQHNEVNLNEIEELKIIPILCLNALVDTEAILNISGLDSLSEIADRLPLNIRMALYGSFCQKLIEPQNHNVRSAMLNCLKKLSLIYQDEIHDCILHSVKITNPVSLDLYLNALCAIIILKHFQHSVSDIVLNYAVDSFDLATVAVKNIVIILEDVSYNTSLLEIFLQKGTINKLVEYAIRDDIVNRGSKSEFLFNISSILKILIGSQESEIQDKIISLQLSIINNCKEQSDEIYVFLLDGLLSRVRRNVAIDVRTIYHLTRISVSHNDGLVKDIVSQLLANLINKQSNDEELNKWLDIIKEHYMQTISHYSDNVISALSWITKALVMRNHFQANLWTETLLEMLEGNSAVAKGFRIIMNDSYDSLSTKSYCTKTLLYRQKFFVYVTNKLSTHYESGKLSYLMAIGYLLENAPEQVILLQLQKILKLIILCLEQQNDPEVLCIILNRITSFINNKEPIIQENLEDILLRILQLSAFEPSMKVRIAALHCLTGFTLLPLYRVLPLRQRVLQQLGLCIDDKKRLVRKEAVEARSAWFLVDAPE